jgi:hypothetical protein
MDATTSPLGNRLTAWTQNVRHTRALRTVLETFDRSGVAALPVKGIVSARTLYGDVADRLLTDVDLKIRERDFDRVLALGTQAGWRVVQRMRAYRNVVFVVDGVCVDIEGYPSPPGLSRLTTDAMISRARPSNVLGFPHLLPNFDDHAAVLLLNVFKDKLIHAFAWSVRDVERLPQHPDFDASRLTALLRVAGATTIAWVVADWMTTERGISSWTQVRDALGPRPPRAAYIALLGWLRGMQPRGAVALRILSRAGADHRIDRARAVAHMVWWQAEALLSRWGDAPFHRQDPARLKGTVFNETGR